VLHRTDLTFQSSSSRGDPPLNLVLSFGRPQSSEHLGVGDAKLLVLNRVGDGGRRVIGARQGARRCRQSIRYRQVNRIIESLTRDGRELSGGPQGPRTRTPMVSLRLWLNREYTLSLRGAGVGVAIVRRLSVEIPHNDGR
jgi:hypothetical protein